MSDNEEQTNMININIRKSDFQKLLTLTKNNHIEIFDVELTKLPNIQEKKIMKYPNFETAMDKLIDLNDVVAVDWLVRHGANVRVNDNTYLIKAARKNHYQIVEMLLFAGADPYARDSLALLNAVEGGHYNTTKILLLFCSYKTSFFKKLIRSATQYGHQEIVQLLLEQSNRFFDTNKKYNQKKIQSAMTKAFMDAVTSDQYVIMEILANYIIKFKKIKAAAIKIAQTNGNNEILNFLQQLDTKN